MEEPPGIIVKPNSDTRFIESLDMQVPKIFLAGSIEMGDAEDWQSEIEKKIIQYPTVVYNPRRDDWDSSWVQELQNDQFRYQVSWELAALEAADLIAMYLAPDTKSPISLLELGLYAKSGKMIVYCPDGFWRKGNVDIVSAVYSFPVYKDKYEWIQAVIDKVAVVTSII